LTRDRCDSVVGLGDGDGGMSCKDDDVVFAPPHASTTTSCVVASGLDHARTYL